MKHGELVQKFEENNFKIIYGSFIESGYEIFIRIGENTKFEDFENMNIEGLALGAIECYDSMYRVVLVPKTLDEVTDYIWRYVEKFGKKDERLINLLGNAVCALEKAIESIYNIEDQKMAMRNLEIFTGQVF